jgi:sorbitol-specific phosphotransferase system component IIA
MVKLLTVVLQESQYEQLVEMGRVDTMTPSQVLVTIVGEYLNIRQALSEIHHVGIRGHG